MSEMAQPPPTRTRPSSDPTHDAGGAEPVVGSAQPLAIAIEREPPVPGAGVPPRIRGSKVRLGDRLLAWLTAGAAGFVVVLVVMIAVFLLLKSVPSILDDKSNFFTSTDWAPTPGNLHFGVASMLWTTVAISIVALVIAVPIAIGIALYITHYAPRRLARPVAYLVDLLAAIPSIIYGIWGAGVLSAHLTGVQRTLYHLGAIPLFANQSVNTGTLFDGSLVLAVMILPIVTAISRDVFARTPAANIEAAWALGATKWEMVRMAVLPYGRAGLVSGSMLGLGRALGETIAVTLILSKVSNFSFSIFSGGETFASKIANNSQEFNNPASTGAYIAAGLVLFVLTFVVNAAARAVVDRKKDFT